ncbi:MAG: hypothetical protein ACI3T9_06865 [Romboutsia timonensis]
MDKIKAVLKSYQEIVDFFTAEKIENRYNVLYDSCNNFIQKNNYQNTIEINELSLIHATMDYFTDIYRLKEFHNIRLVNEYKVISYSTFWLIRRKPLEIVNNSDNDEFLVFANEALGASYLYTELIKSLPLDYYNYLSPKSQKSIDGFVESLFYYFKYRTYTAQDLEMCILSFLSGLLIGQSFPDTNIDNLNRLDV